MAGSVVSFLQASVESPEACFLCWWDVPTPRGQYLSERGTWGWGSVCSASPGRKKLREGKGFARGCPLPCLGVLEPGRLGFVTEKLSGFGEALSSPNLSFPLYKIGMNRTAHRSTRGLLTERLALCQACVRAQRRWPSSRLLGDRRARDRLAVFGCICRI